MGANRNSEKGLRIIGLSLADGGMGANRNSAGMSLIGWQSLADGGMGANRNDSAEINWLMAV